jgi:hypothetical protein
MNAALMNDELCTAVGTCYYNRVLTSIFYDTTFVFNFESVSVCRIVRSVIIELDTVRRTLITILLCTVHCT